MAPELANQDINGNIGDFEKANAKHLVDSPQFLQELMKYGRLEAKDFSRDVYKKIRKDLKGDPLFRKSWPSHELVAYMARENLKQILASEFWVGELFKGFQGKDYKYSGILDLIAIEGDTIYILDYKPDVHYHTIAEILASKDKIHPESHVIRTVAQIAGYALVLDALFGFKAAGFKVKCLTFSGEGYTLYDPFEALEMSVDFYCKQMKKIPDWGWLLQESILRKIATKYGFSF